MPWATPAPELFPAAAPGGVGGVGCERCRKNLVRAVFVWCRFRNGCRSNIVVVGCDGCRSNVMEVFVIVVWYRCADVDGKRALRRRIGVW